MQTDWNENHALLRGEAAAAPVVSHENRGVTYWTFPLRVERLSGAEDRINVVISAGQLEQCPVEPGAEQAVRSLGEIQAPAMDLSTRETKTIALYDVQISATDITYVRSAEDQAWEPLRCALVLSDGTAVEQGNGTSRFRDAAYTQWSSVFYWQVPVDLEQVTAVRFGDTEIPMSDG